MPEALKRLIHSISLMPGIGENRATKLAFFLLQANKNYLQQLSENIVHIQSEIGNCEICHGICDKNKKICNICDSSKRNTSQICIVEEYLDLLTLEQAGMYEGKYHVLGGAISPMNGVFVGDLNFSSLFERIENSSEKLEIILATNPNLEGEATSSFFLEEITARKLKQKVKITRLSRGISAGYLEYADTMSLVNALKERKEI